jgi:bifunctional DNA-binding transcriptional regulator/antitoxin component of YhaV-PrlF toxin-antitoxin module
MKYKLKDRKIMKINRSYLITLPPHWLSNNGLEKGSKLTLYLKEEGLLLTKKENEETA